MSVRLGWLVVLCGCNQTFGLHRTQPVDGPSPDAPFHCPPIGTAPAFSRLIRQSVFQDCDHLTISPDSGIAMAECFAPMSFIGSGPIDGQLAPVAELSPALRYPRLSPDGNELLLQLSSTAIGVFERGSSGAWSLGAQITIVAGDQFSTPTRAPRHLILATRLDNLVHELVEDPAGWTEVASYPWATLGVTDMQGLDLSPDGFRLVFTGTAGTNLDYQMLYADRPSQDARFGPAVPIAGAPVEYDPFLTEDCSRLYFGSNDLMQVLYLQQQ